MSNEQLREMLVGDQLTLVDVLSLPDADSAVLLAASIIGAGFTDRRYRLKASMRGVLTALFGDDPSDSQLRSCLGVLKEANLRLVGKSNELIQLTPNQTVLDLVSYMNEAHPVEPTYSLSNQAFNRREECRVSASRATRLAEIVGHWNDRELEFFVGVVGNLTPAERKILGKFLCRITEMRWSDEAESQAMADLADLLNI